MIYNLLFTKAVMISCALSGIKAFEGINDTILLKNNTRRLTKKEKKAIQDYNEKSSVATSSSSGETDAKMALGFDLDELPSGEDGPERSEKYDPNFGYEPYWVKGQWVFKTVATDVTGNPDINCGLRCGKLYKEYGLVCARDVNFKYKTFYNFCEMRSEDCRGLSVALTKRVNGAMDDDPELQVRYVFNDKIYQKFVTMRDRYYSFSHEPNPGYQPYWKDGEGVIVDPYWALSDSGLTTEAIPQVCGEDCNTSYRGIKEVCTHYTGDNKMKGCWPPLLNVGYCNGNPGDRFYNYFVEFGTYCKYLSLVCGRRIWEERYTLLHIGKCKGYVEDWFKPMFDGVSVVDRLKGYSLWTSVPPPIAYLTKAEQ